MHRCGTAVNQVALRGGWQCEAVSTRNFEAEKILHEAVQNNGADHGNKRNSLGMNAALTYNCLFSPFCEFKKPLQFYNFCQVL